MVRYLQRLDDLGPAGYTVGAHIRFATPLFMRSTYPADWQELYRSRSFALRDPLVFWGISRTGAIRWSEIDLPDPFGIMRQAAEHGLRFGAVAAAGKITSRTIVGVARRDRELTDPEIEALAEIAEGLHEVAGLPPRLTQDELDALRLIDAGAEKPDAALELGITEAALEARLSTVRASLGAETTAEALRMAREYGLI
ncbi:autoinducer binding domain-containing protein [Jannaschia ovalis]|uniref:Autoinducer binding domain-containing protein n=1 Tax=Jannaschia ovalis TaxID=3038773 RepID=A0ABY8LER0_9RHOB|nr:autoinducer binding domain-containing protein [Jannaschia sp. GRR-S6-38]WGH79127.1 autoinducer binding domain-containing protein [Jannaschia sp. GRR-S6-38]